MTAPKINFDSLTKDHWSEQERANVALVADFVQHIMNNHDFDYIRNTFGTGSYIQHNRTIADGIDGVIASVKQLSGRFPDFSYDVKQIYADGDRVVLHSHATLNKKHRGNDKKGLNITDSWKVVDGKLVEHWDSVEPIDLSMRLYSLLNGGAIRNPNGVF